MTSERLSGVLCPVITPFAADLSPDSDRLIQQCRWLLSQNVGLAVFGTNSEANSLSVAEKMSLLTSLVDSGIDTTRLMPGTGCCALTDSVALTAHAVNLGCAGVLVLPPFYYKNVSDEGLFASYSELIERVGDTRLKIYLYHIPPVAQVGISVDLIERLVTRYPETVVGIKDSSGDWDNTQSMLDRGWDDFRVFAGAETFLLQNMQAGGAGCISATANINPKAISELHANWKSPKAAEMQANLDTIRAIALQFPLIPTLKATVAHYFSDPQWRTLRPPLTPLNTEQNQALLSQLAAAGFSMER